MIECIGEMVRVALPENADDDLIEVFIEERSSDWWITYYVYEDYVELVEAMGDNMEHCKDEAVDMDEAISKAACWC